MIPPPLREFEHSRTKDLEAAELKESNKGGINADNRSVVGLKPLICNRLSTFLTLRGLRRLQGRVGEEQLIM